MNPITRDTVLLALPSATLSRSVARLLELDDFEVVDTADDEMLDRYLFGDDAGWPTVVVWHVGVASLVVLHALWRVRQAGGTPRLVIVGCKGAPWHFDGADRIVHASPHAAAIAAAVKGLAPLGERTTLPPQPPRVTPDAPPPSLRSARTTTAEQSTIPN